MDEGDVRHVPVMVSEVVGLLRPRPGKVFVDATVGGGGHALALPEEMGGKGCLIALDRDEEALNAARERLRAFYNGLLKIRPLGRPVHQPTGREKVSQVPEEWKDFS